MRMCVRLCVRVYARITLNALLRQFPITNVLTLEILFPYRLKEIDVNYADNSREDDSI